MRLHDYKAVHSNLNVRIEEISGSYLAHKWLLDRNNLKNIPDLITQTRQEIAEYIFHLEAGVQTFSDEVQYEYNRLQDGRDDLESFTVELNSENSDVSICLGIALEDGEKIFT